MNFHNFHSKLENRLNDAVLSLWSMGDPEIQNYYKYIFLKALEKNNSSENFHRHQ